MPLLLVVKASDFVCSMLSASAVLSILFRRTLVAFSTIISLFRCTIISLLALKPTGLVWIGFGEESLSSLVRYNAIRLKFHMTRYIFKKFYVLIVGEDLIMCSHESGRDMITAWTCCSSVRICPATFRSRIKLDIPLRCSVIKTLGSLRCVSNFRTKILSLVIEVALKVSFNCSHMAIAVGKFSNSHMRSSCMIFSIT